MQVATTIDDVDFDAEQSLVQQLERRLGLTTSHPKFSKHCRVRAVEKIKGVLGSRCLGFLKESTG